MEGKRKRIYRLVAVCLALLVAFTGLLTVQAAGVAKPTKLSAKVNDNVSITLQWTAAKKVSGYQVYTAGSKSGKYTLLATTSATKYTHSNLKGGKTYYYKVRAYKTVKKKKQYSGYTAVVQATAVQYAAQKSLQSLNSKVDGMIRRVTALYSFPVLDLTRESGMQMRSKAFRTAYMADNIHPNAAGHAKFIAPALERFILQHTPVM